MQHFVIVAAPYLIVVLITMLSGYLFYRLQNLFDENYQLKKTFAELIISHEHLKEQLTLLSVATEELLEERVKLKAAKIID
jgi:hypothetical protein